jgi:hypothetical protein
LYVTEQVAELLLAALSLQLASGLKLPGPLVLKPTLPVGVVAPLVEMSVTVAVHVVGLPATTGCGSHFTLVVVGCWMGGAGPRNMSSKKNSPGVELQLLPSPRMTVAGEGGTGLPGADVPTKVPSMKNSAVWLLALAISARRCHAP